MLSVDPKNRPSCSTILGMEIVKRKMQKLFKNNEFDLEDEVIIEEDSKDDGDHPKTIAP